MSDRLVQDSNGSWYPESSYPVSRCRIDFTMIGIIFIILAIVLAVMPNTPSNAQLETQKTLKEQRQLLERIEKKFPSNKK